MYALVDVNAFYASCETVFRPDLRNRPVVVLSNNDGCVIARSAAARDLGIRMGAPFFQIHPLLRRHSVAVFSSNYALYADMSNRVMTTLEQMTPEVEIYSIDEAFLNLSGIGAEGRLEQLGRELKARILRDTHLAVGVGIAPTRTLAKLANHAAKRWPKTGGVVDLSQRDRQRRLLAIMPVEEVWGVGRRLSRSLRGAGIDTALQLASCDPAWVRKTFSVVLERTVRELRGQSCLEAEAVAAARQQIICSRSFSKRITVYEDMRQAVCSYAERAAEKLRGQRQSCRQVSVFIRTSPHAAGEAFCARQASSHLPVSTCDTRDIVRLATNALDQIWSTGRRYMKAGVMLTDFYRHGAEQLPLFSERAPWSNSTPLMQTIDRINQSGKGRVWFAGQGTEQHWAMKRELLSPAYTTRLSDLPVVKAC
ncbi:translesion error-prone DNA polymerase V subunit UmuC [Affinibrenneria salicis]|uniref:Translesion error-prone DNA polymerase V subunit UmuC n=1 Tax=Affinibrenneria salicis TaxID=2590031 RepID=A0A5J5G3S8_9GAMM|nr:translesion error-prone DNA polymerase V subunit UmuC [Affinibrenneria salicis]KAA9001701.1 translesion error-prone DNA polymerase V subunit UmuC [Affinibrenneria salicis]